jgi:hypothetical protein
MRSLHMELHDDLSWVSVCDGKCTGGCKVYWGSGMETAGKLQLNCFVCWWSVVGWCLLTNVEL